MADHPEPQPGEKKGWADSPAFRRFFVGLLVVACIGAGAVGFVHEWHNPHPHFEAEKFPVFFAIYGFVAFSFIVLAGQHLRKLVARDENYYDERE